MHLRAALVTQSSHHEAAFAAEGAHALVVVGRTVVGTDVAAETHVDDPRLVVGLGVGLDGLGLLQHRIVLEGRGNQDEVSLGSHAIVGVGLYLTARSDIGYVGSVAHVIELVGRGALARERARRSAGTVAHHAVAKGGMVVFEALVNDADYDALALEGRFEALARLHLLSARFLACLVHQGMEAAGGIDKAHVAALSERGDKLRGDIDRDDFGGNHLGLVTGFPHILCHGFGVGYPHDGIDRNVGTEGLYRSTLGAYH